MVLEGVSIENESVRFGGKVLPLYTGPCPDRALPSKTAH